MLDVNGAVYEEEAKLSGEISELTDDERETGDLNETSR